MTGVDYRLGKSHLYPGDLKSFWTPLIPSVQKFVLTCKPNRSVLLPWMWKGAWVTISFHQWLVQCSSKIDTQMKLVSWSSSNLTGYEEMCYDIIFYLIFLWHYWGPTVTLALKNGRDEGTGRVSHEAHFYSWCSLCTYIWCCVREDDSLAS